MPRKFRLSEYAGKKRAATSTNPKKKKAKLQENDANRVLKENCPPIADPRYPAKSGAPQAETSSRHTLPNDIFTYFAYLARQYGTSKISPENFLVSKK